MKFFEKHTKHIIAVIFTITTAYVVITTVNAYIATSILIGKYTRKSSNAGASGASFALSSDTDWRRFVEYVRERNIFDSENKPLDEDLPDEKEEEKETIPTGKDPFAIEGPCKKSSQPVKMIGGIIAEDPANSIAFMTEKGFTDPDAYFEGEYLFDEGEVLIMHITRNRVILNNSGKKECLYADEKSEKFKKKVVLSAASDEKQEVAETIGDMVILDGTFIKDQLGPGFANILNKQRLVPNMGKGGKTDGFKIFSIKKGSLFSKIGLSDGDVINGVNDHDLTDPSQGFKLFESIKDESEINISFTRNGVKQQRFIKIK